MPRAIGPVHVRSGLRGGALPTGKRVGTGRRKGRTRRGQPGIVPHADRK